MTYTIEQLETMLESHNGVFVYEENGNYDLRKGPVVGHVVRFRPTPKYLGDGMKSYGLTFPICAATDYVAQPEKAMTMVADALNAMPTLAADLIAARKRIGELEARIRAVIETDDAFQRKTIFRDDGEHSKHDLCVHGEPAYNDCVNCVIDYLSATLEAKP